MKPDSLEVASRPNKLWIPDFDPEKPQLSLSAPREYIDANPIYEEREFLSIGFGHLKRYKDAETKKEQVLFMKNIQFSAPPEFIAEIEKFLTELRGKIALAVGGEEAIIAIDKKPDPKRFWKILLDLPPELIEVLDEEEIKQKLEKSPHGPHVTVENTDGKTILRIKARTLESLYQLISDTFTKIRQQLTGG